MNLFNNVGKIIAIITIAIISISQHALAELKIGDAAPNFTLQGSDGKSHNLSDYSDKVVVLEWLNHDCPFVEKHYDSGNMQNLQKTYTQQDVVWLSIVSSAPGKQGHVNAQQARENEIKKQAHATATLLDPDGTVGKLYNAKTTPHMYIINKDGTLAYQGAIDSINSTSLKDVAKATPYVKNALEEVIAGKQVAVANTKQYGCTIKY